MNCPGLSSGWCEERRTSAMSARTRKDNRVIRIERVARMSPQADERQRHPPSHNTRWRATASPLTRHLVKSDADDAFGSNPPGALIRAARWSCHTSDVDLHFEAGARRQRQQSIERELVDLTLQEVVETG